MATTTITPTTGNEIALMQNLTAIYALAMDECRMEDWKACWCPDDLDPTFENPAGKFVGKEGFEQLIPILTQRLAGKRHFMTNVAVHSINGDYAEQTCYMLILPKSGVPSIIGTAVYRDTLMKIDGHWRFKSRKIEFDPLTV